MPNQRSYLPDIWSDPFVAVVPLTQKELLEYEIGMLSECQCLTVDEEPMNGQDWVELLLQYIEDRFGYDSYVSSSIESLARPNNTALTGAALRRRVLKGILAYLSAKKKLLIYIRRPVSRICETGFDHLGFLVNNQVGILCYAQNPREIPDDSLSRIHFCPMKQILNPNDPVYVSYSRKESSELVDMIVSNLEKEGVKVNLDMRDNGPTKSIKEFETAIGNGSIVVVILSDLYFQSDDCMYEMAALTKRGDLSKRVIFIDRLKDVQRNTESHNLIKEKWQAEFNKYQDVGPTDTALLEKKKDLSDICVFFSTFWEAVEDRVSFMSAAVEADNADSLVTLIKARLSSMNPMIPNGTIDPMNTSVVPVSQITMNQTGNQCVSIGTMNGNLIIGGE
jgi:hypothetical protein